MGLVIVPAFLIALLILFVLIILALRVPKTRWGKLFSLAVVLSPVVWLTWDIPYGYVRFKMACYADAGLKVYEKDLPPAKRIRLVDGLRSGVHVFENYPSIQQIEARDEEFDYVRPTAYAVYERGEDGKLISTSMDKVERVRGSLTLIESAPSKADYVVSQTREILPYRLHRNHYTLSRKNQQLVAETVAYTYKTGDFIWVGAECGPLGSSYYELDTLLSFVTRSEKPDLAD
ncbi:hypothetical protein I5R65_10075 [Herbaspirillum sp. AP02]|uniref:hypothetical protein n=1 Tax=unclassified Herbaspirillum TaxID=2624150 RepID=UPI0015DAA163|nr:MULTISPECIES: hypothetical protein [unclassified Herbaspirillum]MBG7619809.1 hypothetical protein [Herbaspirillum sp. AP02]NZD69880.1 hypothetical protein [Herbaspirillum sp. AP21]